MTKELKWRRLYRISHPKHSHNDLAALITVRLPFERIQTPDLVTSIGSGDKKLTGMAATLPSVESAGQQRPIYKGVTST